MTREKEALTIESEEPFLPPVDEKAGLPGLSQVFQEMEGNLDLALRDSQKDAIIKNLTLLREQKHKRHGVFQTIDKFRKSSAQKAILILKELNNDQVNFIVKNRENSYIVFESSYWKKLCQLLSLP